MVTENPLAWSSFPSEAGMIPLPKDDVTPPVTKIYLAEEDIGLRNFGCKGRGFGNFQTRTLQIISVLVILWINFSTCGITDSVTHLPLWVYSKYVELV